MNAQNNQNASPIEELRSVIVQHMFIPEVDQDLIDFVFATFVSHQIPGDPLWGLLIDASGGGKTELVRTLQRQPDSCFVSKLTEKSLKSGYRDKKNPDKDPSLLPTLHEKVLIIKDLSPILSMRHDSRNVIIGDLRDAYDGFSDDSFGNIGKVSYRSRFTLLAGCTLAIERFSGVDQELGERFVKFRAQGTDNAPKIRKALRNTARDDSNRQTVESAVSHFLKTIPPFPASLTSGFLDIEMENAMVAIADFVATSRSPVARDRNHELSYIPRPEVGTRLGKELHKLLLSLAHIRGKARPDPDDLLTVCRVGDGCLPPNRLEVLDAVCAGRRHCLPETTARNAIRDLEILGVLTSKGDLQGNWQASLGSVRKLLVPQRLQKPATSGVSRVFMADFVHAPTRPPVVAGGTGT